jgi:hypothetical protein
VYASPVQADSGAPFPTIPLDPFERRAAVAPESASHILRARARAQIRNTIIIGIPVSVIDFFGRVLTVDIEPCEPMSQMVCPFDTNHDIPVPVMSACGRSSSRASSRLAPIKKPRFRGVVKELAEVLRRQAELSFAEHEECSKQKRPAAVRLRARFRR